MSNRGAVTKTQLRDFLTHVRDFTVDMLEANDLPVPATQLVTHGPPPVDCCDMLAVQWEIQRPSRQSPNPNFGTLQCASLLTVKIKVTVMRCVTTVRDGNTLDQVLPTDDEQTDDALMLADDAWVLFNDYLCALITGSIFDPDCGCCPPSCTATAFEGVSPIAPRGGCAGNLVTFTIQLDPSRAPVE